MNSLLSVSLDIVGVSTTSWSLSELNISCPLHRLTMAVERIHAREILDSRGNPTVEVDLYTHKGMWLRIRDGGKALPTAAELVLCSSLACRDHGGSSLVNAQQTTSQGKRQRPKLCSWLCLCLCSATLHTCRANHDKTAGCPVCDLSHAPARSRDGRFFYHEYLCTFSSYPCCSYAFSPGAQWKFGSTSMAMLMAGVKLCP